MAASPRAATPTEQERSGALALALVQLLGGSAAIQAVLPDIASKGLSKLLLSLADKFGINSFSLTSPDLSNIGVAICPVVALINHSCAPNCAVVFPEGPSKEMSVIAFSRIEIGEEVSTLPARSKHALANVIFQILSSYVDLVLPVVQRQEELNLYKFHCKCPTCISECQTFSHRKALLCSKRGCSGILPIPGPSLSFQDVAFRIEASLDMKDPEVFIASRCELCSNMRKINLGRSDDEDLGLRWALNEADLQLSVTRPIAFENLRKSPYDFIRKAH